jgi:hypothetical protein
MRKSAQLDCCGWPAADARDDLRALLPRLDAAIAAGALSTEALKEFRRILAWGPGSYSSIR